MPNLMPTDIVTHVEAILLAAPPGKFNPPRPSFLTAYQILNRLPVPIRTRLISERTIGGLGTGVHYAATSVVADAAERISGIIKEYIDDRGIQLEVAGLMLVPGFELCGIYRLNPQSPIATSNR